MALAQSIAEHLEEYFETCSTPGSVVCGDGLYRVVVREVERPLLQKALDMTQGNQSRAAALLEIGRAHV